MQRKIKRDKEKEKKKEKELQKQEQLEKDRFLNLSDREKVVIQIIFTITFNVN